MTDREDDQPTGKSSAARMPGGGHSHDPAADTSIPPGGEGDDVRDVVREGRGDDRWVGEGDKFGSKSGAQISDTEGSEPSEINVDEDAAPQAPAGIHVEGTKKGEEVPLQEGKERGRESAGETGAGRPAGTRTSEDATGMDKHREPIDPESPEIPPA